MLENSIRRTPHPQDVAGLSTQELRDTFQITNIFQPDEIRILTEAAIEVTRFWFEDLNQPVLRIKKARDNAASRAISLRQGMRCVGQTESDYVSGRLPTEIWELTAEQWRSLNPLPRSPNNPV